MHRPCGMASPPSPSRHGEYSIVDVACEMQAHNVLHSAGRTVHVVGMVGRMYVTGASGAAAGGPVQVRRLLKKLQFLFELPQRLNRAVEIEAYSEAVKYAEVSKGTPERPSYAGVGLSWRGRSWDQGAIRGRHARRGCHGALCL